MSQLAVQSSAAGPRRIEILASDAGARKRVQEADSGCT